MNEFSIGDRVRFTNTADNTWPWFEGATGTVVNVESRIHGDDYTSGYTVLWDAGSPVASRSGAESGERMKDPKEHVVGGKWLTAATVDIDISDPSEVEAFLNG